jgi:hypothetical protein
MKKIILKSVAMFTIVLMVFMQYSVIATPAETTSVSNNSTIVQQVNIDFQNIKLQNIGSMSTKYSLIINGEQNNLFPTFDEPVVALQNFKTAENELLNDLKNAYGLDELTNNNYEKYSAALDTYLGTSSTLKESSKDVSFFRSFIDIYKNDAANQDILNYIKDKTETELSNDIIFISMLPYTTPLITEYNQQRKKSQLESALGISLLSLDDSKTKEVAYAYTYASNRNSDYYASFDSDCTNFVSQILDASGRSHTSDWWHFQVLGEDFQSLVWVNANAFVNYWGTTITTSSNYYLSANLQDGEFIGLDMSNDGSWDHCGFVIASNNYLTDEYYDYLVAQHSDDYIAWATSDTNGWDNYDHEGNYAIINL